MEALAELLAIHSRASIMILPWFDAQLEKQKKYNKLFLPFKLKSSWGDNSHTCATSD